MKFHHTQKVLRTHEEKQEKIKEVRFSLFVTLAVTATTPTQHYCCCCPQVLSALPEVALGCQELQSLLCYLGLKPASKEAAEPL